MACLNATLPRRGFAGTPQAKMPHRILFRVSLDKVPRHTSHLKVLGTMIYSFLFGGLFLCQQANHLAMPGS